MMRELERKLQKYFLKKAERFHEGVNDYKDSMIAEERYELADELEKVALAIAENEPDDILDY